MQRETVQYRRDLAVLRNQLVQAVGLLINRPKTASIDQWWSQVSPLLVLLLRQFSPSFYTAAFDYLVAVGAKNGVAVDPARVALDVGRLETSLLVTGPVAFKRAVGNGRSTQQAIKIMSTGIVGSATRQAMNIARLTVNTTAENTKQIVGWQRITDGHPCAFCALLASRGAVYFSENTATVTESGAAYHDHCACVSEPLFKHQKNSPTADDLYTQYQQATTGETGKGAIRAWRRYWETKPH